MTEKREIDAALAKAQGVLSATERGATGQARAAKYKYSTIADVWNAIRRPLSENGLCITQTEDFAENWVILTTTLRHTSGETIHGQRPIFTIEGAIRDPQAYGSALTYARRYGITALVGIAPADDDDGATAKAAGHQSMGKTAPAGPRGGQDRTAPTQGEIKLYGYPEGGTKVTKTYTRAIGGVASFIADLEVAVTQDPMTWDTNSEGIEIAIKGIDANGRADLREKLENIDILATDLGRNLGTG